jgi:hypothetical protein
MVWLGSISLHAAAGRILIAATPLGGPIKRAYPNSDVPVTFVKSFEKLLQLGRLLRQCARSGHDLRHGRVTPEGSQKTIQ